MSQATADFELGVNTDPVLTADTGSATAWDSRVNLGAGNSITYDSTHAYGSLAAKVDSTGTPGSANLLAWTTGIGTLTDWYGRLYLYATAFPTGGSYRIAIDSNNNFVLFIAATGEVQQYDQGGFIHSTTATISLNQWVRIEWHWLNSATVGLAEVKLFNSPDSTTATETKTSAANRNTSASTTEINFGLNGGTSVGTPIWLDNVVAGATSYPGPATSAQLLVPTTDSVDGAWTDQSGGSSLFAAIDESSFSDADYIRSELSPSASGCRVKLASGGDPASSSGHKINWRAGKSATGGQTINMTVKLYQGGGNSLGGGTLIADFDRNAVDALTTYTETLSGGEADSITNYADLYLEFWATV